MKRKIVILLTSNQCILAANCCHLSLARAWSSAVTIILASKYIHAITISACRDFEQEDISSVIGGQYFNTKERVRRSRDTPQVIDLHCGTLGVRTMIDLNELSRGRCMSRSSSP